MDNRWKEEVANISVACGSVNSGYETEDGTCEDSEAEAENRIGEQSETDDGEEILREGNQFNKCYV